MRIIVDRPTTHSGRSRSERVNELLRRANLQDQYIALEQEAAKFFTSPGKTERTECRAFSAAAITSITRNGER
jgi:hypothetical protein